VLLALDERLGVEAQQLAQRAQELGRAVQPDRRLQVGLVQASQSLRPNSRYMQMLTSASPGARISARCAAQRHHHVDLGADAFDQAADLGQVRPAC
jgi:hypothetical protein